MVRIVRMPRRRVTRVVRKASSVVEAEAGSFREWNLSIGDELEIR